MAEQPKGGPIRRKAGARRAEREARRSERTPPPTATPLPAPEAPDPAPVVARPVGRRVFEPPGRSSAGKASGGDRARAPRRAPSSSSSSSSSSSDTPPDAQKLSPEVVAKQQETARKLSVDKGIPQVHALRVVRGEVSLNVVLKNLMRKERATRLVEHDGLEPGLAGQVASGHLSRERAMELQRIRAFRKHRIDRDALKLAEIGGAMIAVGCFDGTWAAGKVVAARTYEFDLAPLEGGEQQLIQKHDVKLVCLAADAEKLREVETCVTAIRDAGLGGTADRAERVRPTDARMIQLIDSEESVDCVLRDGSSYSGVLRSFGRWDMAIEIEGVGLVTILFHSLHKSNTWTL